MTKSLIAACLIVGLTLAGCGVPPGPGEVPSPDTSSAAPPDSSSTAPPDAAPRTLSPRSALTDQLTGRSFTTRDAADVTGFSLVDGSALTLSFSVGADGSTTIGAGAGCNKMGGPVTWDGATFRPAEGFFRTEMACEGLMDQEDWFFALLNSGVTLTLDGAHLTATDAPVDAGVVITLTDAAKVEPSTPSLGTEVAEADNPLLGKTFELTRTFTDDGGADHKHADATLRLTFGADQVAADGSCGPFSYDDVRYIADPEKPAALQYVDLGRPGVAGCVIGDDPGEPPFSKLMYGLDGDEMWLSTGFVAWYFRPLA